MQLTSSQLTGNDRYSNAVMDLASAATRSGPYSTSNSETPMSNSNDGRTTAQDSGISAAGVPSGSSSSGVARKDMMSTQMARSRSGNSNIIQPGVGARQIPLQDQASAGPGGVVRRPTLNAVIVNVCQKGNPIIAYIRNVAWEYGDIVPDYQVGTTTGVLFLSLRYHLLHPEYIHTRIEKLGQSYSLRVLLIMCDVDNYTSSMRELTKVSIVNGYTIMVAWSAQEAGRYLEIYKTFERKPPDLIKERVDNDYMSLLTSALTSIRGINKTDVTTLASNYGSLEKIATASPESLVQLPGLGEKKVKNLRDAFSGSFVVRPSKKRKKSMAEGLGEIRNELN